ncbi:unnamed protein product [Effrenium voratum]|nr:unnamed protein product [Effrenium voratum]
MVELLNLSQLLLLKTQMLFLCFRFSVRGKGGRWVRLIKNGASFYRVCFVSCCPGRAATEVLSGDEVTIIEVVFHNVLDGCSAAEVAAAVSAFVFPDKVDEQEDLEELPANLSRVRAGILQQHRRVELLLRDRRVEMDAEV